ncbi:hypothetical protein [Niabella drilacis]|uniref:DUF4843 domain-containing protein n=1 Tax=Niabella drilacis (strain DSM 25811 / CCM 8410 / CCUG 62505 / LMG 26954 / E90) TaxID=1285928 RepID=A0A1G6IAY9_NIADE|nr:hypothetical protein [Niabella drilacis]SDC03175.1 hypothetical protein SAMN04487894_101145 [Niabella drilacis]
MKSVKYIYLAFLLLFAGASCEKKDYPKGLAELEHHYYVVYYPNTNDTVRVNRSQTALLKLPIQFYSGFTRSYDAKTYYRVETSGIANPAVLGQDFNVVDRQGNVLQPVDGRFSILFPQAKQTKDTIYIRLLNNSTPGTRRAVINLIGDSTSQYVVDTFSTAHKRPLVIQ